MILTDIKTYLATHKRSTLVDMANHFHLSPSATKGMVDHWIRKGKVRHIQAGQCNQSCCHCDIANRDVYEWINESGDEI